MATTPPNTPGTPPARKVAENETFMREVDEAVRQDEVATFASRYGVPIGIAVLLALLAFAGYLFWDSSREGTLEEGSEQLVSALDELEEGDPTVADAELASIAASAEPGAAAMARMARAGLALQEGRNADAAALYGEVVGTADLPEELRNLASIRQVAAEFDELDPQTVIDRLGPLAIPGNPWFGSAGELVAFAYIAQGNEDQAGPLLVEIAQDEDVPETLRSRARQLAGLLGFDPIEDVDEVLEQLSGGGTPPGAVAQ